MFRAARASDEGDLGGMSPLVFSVVGDLAENDDDLQRLAAAQQRNFGHVPAGEHLNLYSFLYCTIQAEYNGHGGAHAVYAATNETGHRSRPADDKFLAQVTHGRHVYLLRDCRSL